MKNKSFYHCTVHLEIYVVHSPTNALLISFVKSFKFTLKYTIISLLHVSVFNDHHRELYLYLTKDKFIVFLFYFNFTECFNINII